MLIPCQKCLATFSPILADSSLCCFLSCALTSRFHAIPSASSSNSPCSPGWCGTCSVAQAGLEFALFTRLASDSQRFSCLYLLRARIKGMCTTTVQLHLPILFLRQWNPFRKVLAAACILQFLPSEVSQFQVSHGFCANEN